MRRYLRGYKPDTTQKKDDTYLSRIFRQQLFFRLIRYIHPHRRIVALMLGFLLLTTAIDLIPDILIGKVLIDRLLAPSAEEGGSDIFEPLIAFILFIQYQDAEPHTLFVRVIVALILINITKIVLATSRAYLTAGLGQRVASNLRREIYQHLHKLSLGFYHKQKTGRIMSCITTDVPRIQNFIAEFSQEAIYNLLMMTIMCGIMLHLNWKLAVLVLLPTPALGLINVLLGRKMAQSSRKLSRWWAKLNAILVETIHGVHVVKAFNQESREIDKFAATDSNLLDAEIDVAQLWLVFGPLISFVTFISTIIIWGVGGPAVLAGEISLGTLMIFMRFVMRFLRPIHVLCKLYPRFKGSAVAAERVFEILDTQPDVAEAPNAIEFPRIKGDVEFRNVSFSYNGGHLALDGINFKVAPGEMIGLVGPSGAGKSTLINLICRFYDAQEGAILIDGIDTRHITLKSLRRQISIVLQDPFLFNGTIAENIAYGKPDATQNELVAAAKAANAHDFIMRMHHGYQTVVGERGIRISVGERQRISIARAILKAPRILILDEATSSVDADTEFSIQQGLERLICGRTVFAIAHRLSTLKHANRLIVLKDGRINGIGPHHEILQKNKIYAKLCHLQSEKMFIDKSALVTGTPMIGETEPLYD